MKLIIGWINLRDGQAVRVDGTRYLSDQGPIIEYFTTNVMSFARSERTIGLMIWKGFFLRFEKPKPGDCNYKQKVIKIGRAHV